MIFVTIQKCNNNLTNLLQTIPSQSLKLHEVKNIIKKKKNLLCILAIKV